MSKIYIAHPDQNVRNALIQTLKTIMPDADFGPGEAVSEDENIVFKAFNTPQRLKTLLAEMNRMAARQKRPATLDLGAYRLDVHAREFFTPENSSMMLTEKEVDVLIYLFQRKKAATRDDLLQDVWNYAADVDTHTIETHIYRLRQKIEPDAENPTILITTKDGYQLAAVSKA